MILYRRTRTLLWPLRACRLDGEGGEEIRFQLLVQNDRQGPKEVTLKAVCGPGDDRKPVITVMLPEEDG